MLTRMTIMLPGLEPEEREVELPQQPGYEALAKLLLPILGAGNFPEHVFVLYDGRRADMFVDDCGHLKGLNINLPATEIYHAAGKARGSAMVDAPAIVGPAVLFHRQIWF